MSHTQASVFPARSEKLESHWQYSLQSSLLRTYSVTTAQHTLACRNTMECIFTSASSSMRWTNVCVCSFLGLTIPVQSAEGQAGKSLEADWPGLCSDEWCHTKSEMHLTASVRGWQKKVLRHYYFFFFFFKTSWLCEPPWLYNLDHRDKTSIHIIILSLSPTSSSRSGWMSSISLWANFCSFNHCWDRNKKITVTETALGLILWKAFFF